MKTTIYVIQVYGYNRRNGWKDIGLSRNKKDAVNRAEKYSKLWSNQKGISVRVILRLKNIKNVEFEQMQDEENY